MKTKAYKQFNEDVKTFTVKNRLKVMVIRKRDFHKTYVTISSPLGSIHHGYKDNDKSVRVPAGIAHFLEHKIFEQNGEDISRIFALKEAQINAFTEHNRTTYLFNATAHVHEHITRLVTMFFHPQFTEEGVAKEKNVIKEELNMHLDDPYYIQYHTLLNNMFHRHPIKDDILGDETSIDAMSPEVLKAMHEAYYQPEISSLVVIGDLEAEALKTTLEATITLPEKSTLLPLDDAFDEPSHVLKNRQSIDLDILVPSVLVGLKHMPKANETMRTRLVKQLAFTMFLDLVFGKSSDYYEQLLDQGLINDSYGLDVQLESSYGYVMVGSESQHPDQLEQILRDKLLNFPNETIDKEDFNRVKKQMIGNFIMSLDSLEYLAHENSRYTHEDITLYDVLDIALTIDYSTMMNQAEAIDDTMLTSVVIKPKK